MGCNGKYTFCIQSSYHKKKQKNTRLILHETSKTYRFVPKVHRPLRPVSSQNRKRWWRTTAALFLVFSEASGYLRLKNNPPRACTKVDNGDDVARFTCIYPGSYKGLVFATSNGVISSRFWIQFHTLGEKRNSSWLPNRRAGAMSQRM